MPVCTTGRIGQDQGRERTGPLALDGWREDGSNLVVLDQLERLCVQRRCEVNQIRFRHTLTFECRWLGHEGLRRCVPLTGHSALFDGPLFDRPHGLTRGAIQYVDPSLFGRLRDCLDQLLAHIEVRQDRRARDVHVPDPVVHELIVPFAPAGIDVDGDQRFAEQAVSRAMPAVVVPSRQLDGQVHEAQLFVGAHLRPDTGIAGVRP